MIVPACLHLATRFFSYEWRELALAAIRGSRHRGVHGPLHGVVARLHNSGKRRHGCAAVTCSVLFVDYIFSVMVPTKHSTMLQCRNVYTYGMLTVEDCQHYWCLIHTVQCVAEHTYVHAQFGWVCY